MKTLGVIANCGKPRAVDVLHRVAQGAAALGLDLVVDEPTSALLPDARTVSLDAMTGRVDSVLVLGGDGTMLSAVRALGPGDTPVIGVNIGGLGFLTSVSEDDIELALECLAEGRFSVSERALAGCTVRRKGQEAVVYRALNEVAVNREPSSRIATLDVAIDGERVTSYMCDGLIVSTPTGSTAYSLSSGGAIVLPEIGALLISVICPHTLSSRPLVVPDTSEISISLGGRESQVILSVDGQIRHPLEREDVVCVRAAAGKVRLVHLPDYSYFSVLRRKLHWRGSSI